MLLNRDPILLREVLQLNDLVVLVYNLLACRCLEDIELFYLLDNIASLSLQVEKLFLVHRGDHYFLRHGNYLL